jgi:NAD(P)H-flavin reductase
MKLPSFSVLLPARLVRARPAAAEQVFVDVEPPEGFAEAYERPGQFCKIRVGEVEGIFAMFSAPHEPGARFLVRVGNAEGGEAADRLAELPPGAPIEMSLPAGEGFALERARGRDVYLFATGTGVAPVRAALERLLADRQAYGALSLDYGVRSLEHLAIEEDIARWRDAGVRVHVHVSSPDLHGTVRGTTVQSALRERGADLHRAAVLAVGQPEMLDSLLAEVVALGVDPELFLKNI